MKHFWIIYFLFNFSYVFSQSSDAFVIDDSITIKTQDGGVLTLSVVLNRKDKNLQNAILINTIYSDIRNNEHVKLFVKNGYAAVILNTRGKYLSTDTIEPFEHEADDINETIEWIIKQPWSNGKVGMVGGSYLGFSQWAAMKKLHPALKTIIPEASVGIGTMDFPMRNNVFMSYSLRWLDQVTNGRMTDYADFNNEKKWRSIFRNWYVSGKSFRKLDSISGKSNMIFQRWLNHPDDDDYWRKMIPYGKEFSKINIPVLTITGYFDWNQRGALYYFNQHYQYNKKADHYLVIGPYDHFGAQGNISTSFRGYTIDPAAKIDIYGILIQWLDFIFKGKQKPLFLKDRINYQVMGTNMWRSLNSIDDANVKEKLKLYLENQKHLSASKSNGNAYSVLKVDLKDRTDADELLGLKYNIIDHFIYNKNNLLYISEAFNEPFEFTGNFSGALKFSVNKKDIDLYMNLYEEMPDGQYFLLSTCLSRASYAKDSGKRNLLKPHSKESITIKNNEFISKKIGKGSRLVLMIGIVKSPFWQINYGTGGNVSDETILNTNEPVEIRFYNDSYIEIPAINNKVKIKEFIM